MGKFILVLKDIGKLIFFISVVELSYESYIWLYIKCFLVNGYVFLVFVDFKGL